jgi:hypothetical protein
VTDVTSSDNENAADLSAADEQPLRELTGRARAGDLDDHLGLRWGPPVTPGRVHAIR